MIVSSNTGMSKHRKSGHTPKNFTGKQKIKRTRRKGLTRKQRRMKRGKQESFFTKVVNQ